MICTRTNTECPTPNACPKHRLVVCPLRFELPPCDQVEEKCVLHSMCPAGTGDPEMIALLHAEEQEWAKRDDKTLDSCRSRFNNNGSFKGYLPRTPEEEVEWQKLHYGNFDLSEDKSSNQRLSEREFAVRDLLLANDKLGSWMSAALEDPASCAEFKADIKNWMKADQEARKVFGL